MSGVFTEDKITDSKRLVRGEQHLLARTLLTQRSIRRFNDPKILILCGHAPHEEVGAINALWKAPTIVAVDTDPVAVERAITAGVTTAVHGDLDDLLPTRCPMKGKRFGCPEELGGEKFDIISLDLCTQITDESLDLARRCRLFALSNDGVMIASFSYGRDVAEFFLAAAHGGSVMDPRSAEAEALVTRGVPDTVAGRIIVLARSLGRAMGLRSVMLYRGRATPMISTVWEAAPPAYPYADNLSGCAVVKVCDGDLEEAVVHPEPMLLYATPADRVLAMRRSAAARKAVATRTAIRS